MIRFIFCLSYLVIKYIQYISRVTINIPFHMLNPCSAMICELFLVKILCCIHMIKYFLWAWEVKLFSGQLWLANQWNAHAWVEHNCQQWMYCTQASTGHTGYVSGYSWTWLYGQQLGMFDNLPSEGAAFWASLIMWIRFNLLVHF